MKHAICDNATIEYVELINFAQCVIVNIRLKAK